jgi:cytochrome P450
MSDVIDFDRSKVLDVDLFGTVKRDPGRHLVEWAGRAPFYVMVDGRPQAVITRYADQKAVYEDFGRFSSAKRRWPGTEMFYYYRGLPVITDNDPPAQIRLRRLMAPAFSPRKLASVEAGVRNFVRDRIDGIAARGGVFDMVAEVSHPLAAAVLLGLCLDLPQADWPIFVRVARGMAAFGVMKPGAAPPPEYLDAWEAGRAYCERLIEDRRSRPADDMIGNIVAACDKEARISTDEMFATLLVLYTAGFGGITNTPAFALWRLCRDRGQLERLRSDPALVPGAVAESVRMDTNAWTTLRWATRDFEFEGLQFFEGMPVHLVCPAPNYDPSLVEDPLRFDMTRKPNDLGAFGLGVHHCIGMGLAKMTARIAIGAVIERFPELRLDDPEFRPEIVGGPKERGIKSLPLRIG